jgi:hypothetical protein
MDFDNDFFLFGLTGGIKIKCYFYNIDNGVEKKNKKYAK